MSKSLVIVESPAKAKSIGKYLGKDFVVEASIGHVKDLPKNKIGVELENGTFEPDLIVMPDKVKVVDRLRKMAGKTTNVYLAPDPDREGEAIAAHLEDELRAVSPKNSIQRVTFNEITPKAVRAAFEHPATGGPQPGGCAADAARAGSHCGLPDFAAAVGQGAPRTLRRAACRRWRCG